MTLTDCRGVETSAADQAELDAFEAAFTLFLNYEMAAGPALKQVLADHPSSVLTSVLRGYALLMLETTGVQDRVAGQAQAVLDTADHANERERLHLQALVRWAGGDVFAAAEIWDRLLATQPCDLLALKMHHYTTFWTGRANVLLATVEGVIDAWDEATPGYDHVLGMQAFALNETGRYEQAEEIGRQAVASNSEDLWSIHAVAHALEMQGDLAGGEALFDVDPVIWQSKNPFVGHIWWHSALFPWNGGHYDRVLTIYDDRLRPASSEFFLDIQNLSSLLARLEHVGVDVGDRWDELGDYAAGRIGDHVLAFTDVHCALSLARTGRLDDLDDYTRSLREHGSELGIDPKSQGIDVALQLCHYFGLFGRSDHSAAAASLLAIRSDLAPIGGSHAQRDLFDLLLIDSVEATDDLDLALHLLRARTRRWPNSVPAWHCYADVLAAAGHDGPSAVATRRAMEVGTT